MQSAPDLANFDDDAYLAVARSVLDVRNGRSVGRREPDPLNTPVGDSEGVNCETSVGVPGATGRHQLAAGGTHTELTHIVVEMEPTETDIVVLSKTHSANVT